MSVSIAVALSVLGIALASISALATSQQNPRTVLSVTHENSATRIAPAVRVVRAVGMFCLMFGGLWIGPHLWPRSFAGPMTLSMSLMVLGYFLPYFVIVRRHNSALTRHA